MKTGWYWIQESIQSNIIEGPEINPYISSKLIFIRVPRKFNRERIGLSTNGVGKTGYPHTKEWSWIILYIKIN